MSILQGAARVVITGGTQIATSTVNNINQSGQGALKDLSDAAAHQALHDSSARFDAPRCHRNTRTTYLDALECWMLGLGEEYASSRLIWLTGGAGAGKSAIMQSIIERCAGYTLILGTFFFCRTDPSRNYAEVLIPTLAYQLASAFPAAMDILEPIIQHNPLIFKSSIQTQAYELLVRPLLYLVEAGVVNNNRSPRKVFIIDGLDECDNPKKQAQIIQVLSTTLCDHNIPVLFVIASRPEVAISGALQKENRLHSLLSSITLDNTNEARSDIRQFIEDSFLDIRDGHPLRAYIPMHWPYPGSVDALVRKSSGHFIYAATAMKFISSLDEHPARALDVVEGLMPSRTENPFAELDALYLHILKSAKYGPQVLEILWLCVYSTMIRTVTGVCVMYPHFSPEDIVLFLSDVQALVSLDPNQEAEMFITLKHASLGDFFRDVGRSHSVYTSQREYLASLLPRYFSLLDDSSQFLPCKPDRNGIFNFINELNYAIISSQNVVLLQSLISGHSPHVVWKLCLSLLEATTADIYWNQKPGCMTLVSGYMRAIRDSAANHNNALYIHHFEEFIQVLIDCIKTAEPHYQIIPALIFSSSSSSLAYVARHLIAEFPKSISFFYCFIFSHMDCGIGNTTHSFQLAITDPRSYEAIRSVSQAQLPWGSDLANGLEIVLQHLVEWTWTPECLHPSPHKKWLNKTKPFKYMSQGFPKLASTFYMYLSTLPTPQQHHWHNICINAFSRHGIPPENAETICSRMYQCHVYLKAVIHYLPKCDSTSALAKLARRSLPKGALWFPRLMKKARAAMDDYVRRWDDSLNGLVEKTVTMTINGMD